FAEIITNVFENGNAIFGYAACEKLNDGRGFTCGRIGFTTGTGDALTVLQKYEEVSPNSTLLKYIPALQKIDSLAHCDSKRDSTSEIVDFDHVWTNTSCQDSKFNSVQDLINDEMYFTPAMKFAKRLGIQSNLGKAILY
ncbi:glycoside hydrolase, partial [Basidiobolus meristosporus CBS 931.73]